jgi:DNA-binding LacI/PurR family transcriptional regulator
LNGHPGVSEATRRRILAIAEETGWHPNRAARALSASRSGAVGLALARSVGTLAYEPFFARLLSGIEAVLSARQIALVLQMVEDVSAEAEALRGWWAERRVDGVLLVDLRFDDPRIPLMEELGMPAVIVGGPGPTGSLPFFASDDAGGVRKIVEHLVSLGHRHIDRVAGSPEFVHTHVRTRAFEQALVDAGASGRVLPTDFSGPAGALATRELLASTPPPTAVVYDNDIMAVSGLGVAQEMGITVPDDLSIVSYDDHPVCEVVHPSLTACSRDIVAYGTRAARGLLAVLDGEAVEPHMEEPPRLVARASTVAPREARARA